MFFEYYLYAIITFSVFVLILEDVLVNVLCAFVILYIRFFISILFSFILFSVLVLVILVYQSEQSVCLFNFY